MNGLQEFFRDNPKAAIAFSGGADSAYLLYAAIKSGAEVKAYYVRSAFQPRFELEDAERFAAEYGADMRIIDADILSVSGVRDNPTNRCYLCKRHIFSLIDRAAREDGFTLILDGTNASDDANHRPGMKALAEMSVRSPLRECGITKAMLRELSKEAGLFTWDKPAYACLATRISQEEEITREKLEITERAEGYMRDMGFSDLRIRMNNGRAKIQLPEGQLGKFAEHREEIIKRLSEYYEYVIPEAEVRK